MGADSGCYTVNSDTRITEIVFDILRRSKDDILCSAIAKAEYWHADAETLNKNEDMFAKILWKDFEDTDTKRENLYIGRSL
jgi:uncharacterized protein (DUF427 family)